MRKNTGKNVVIALALIGALALVITRRVLPFLSDRATYTDGEHTYTLDKSDGIRFAVWEAAQRLGGEVNSPARESRPAVSPDGRLLVFAVGEPGLNADLYVADLVDGQPRDPRPLTGVNSEGDELAPAFGENALYFASNRAGGAGGFDLFAATWNGLDFEPPAPVGGGINSASDELDPAPLGTPGLAAHNGRFGWREALAFASNRAQGGRGDLDLYLAMTGGAEGRIDVIPFPGANTEFDEREPDFTPDGNALYFASDRVSERASGRAEPVRDFDLYRTVLELGEWLPPMPLAGLNTSADERGPQSSPDGFELYFSRERASLELAPVGADPAERADPVRSDRVRSDPVRSEPGDLFRARSTELFRLPREPQSWLDLLLIAALLLLALLAWLAQRWEQLDILYKCFLASLLLHLLLMWFLREVYPEPGKYDLPSGREPTFQVRVLSSRAEEQGLSERGGALEVDWNFEQQASPSPERIELASVAPARAISASAPERFERETDAPVEAPTRRLVEVTEPERSEVAAGPRLQDREQPLVRIQGSAPDLVFAVSATPAVSRETPQVSDRPGRAVTTAAVSERSVRVTPSVSAVERGVAPLAARGSYEVSDPAPLELEPLDPRGLLGPALMMPVDEVAVVALGPAPEAGLPEPLDVAAVRSPSGGLSSFQPTRVAAPSYEAPASSTARPELAGASPDLFRQALEMPEPQRFRPNLDARPAPSAPAPRGPGLAQPAAAESVAGRVRAGPAAELGMTGPRALAAAPDRDFEALRSGGPTDRLALASVRPLEERPSPAQRSLIARPRDVNPLPQGPERSEEQPYRSRFGSEKKIAIETFGGGADTEAAVQRGLAYLARRQTTRGNWGDAEAFHPKYRQVAVGNSGLAMLAFLGAGHTHQSGTDHSENVQRVIDWLLSVQDDRTGHFGSSSSYSHGIATYALAECYALTGDDRLRRPLERAVGQILRNQVPANYRGDQRMIGGWSYYYPDGSTYDAWPRVSITSWQVMALESARLGGLIVPEHSLEMAKQFIVGSWDERLGAVRYSHDPDRLNSGYPTLPGSTPAGLFVLSLLGEDISSERFVAPRNYLLRRMPDGFRFTSEDDFVFRAQGNVYFWYYSSLALLRAGGAEWERWNVALKATLLPAQRDDGSWRPLDVYAEYAGDTKSDSVYTTTMCVLTLEVYYRYFTPLLERR